MNVSPIPLATDEDVALRALADFPLLCPHDQKLAAGNDGVFLAEDPWVLRSHTVDFQLRGLAEGHVVQLFGKGSGFRMAGELFVITSVESATLTLRRKGQAAFVGEPPAPLEGLTGVEFLVTTLEPQIATASDLVRYRLGIDDRFVFAAVGDPLRFRPIRDCVVLTVLQRQYFAVSRGSSDGSNSFAIKARTIQVELDNLLSTFVSNTRTEPSPRCFPGFGTRLSR